MLVSLLFGILDAVKASTFAQYLPEWTQHLPLAEQGLAWLSPSLLVFVVVGLYDRLCCRQVVAAKQ